MNRKQVLNAMRYILETHVWGFLYDSMKVFDCDKVVQFAEDVELLVKAIDEDDVSEKVERLLVSIARKYSPDEVPPVVAAIDGVFNPRTFKCEKTT